MKDKVMIHVEKMIEHSGDGLLSPTICIYKVPRVIREVKEDAYTPKVVSIGPFHYGNDRLQEMERHKQVFFKRFTQEAKINFDDLLSYVIHSEPEVRASYSENINLNEEELVKVILVDASFIIQLFRMSYMDQLEEDSKLSQPYLEDAIRTDLVLLENQLPLFFLEELFNRAFPVHLRDRIPSFLKLMYHYFHYFNMQTLQPDHSNVRIKHFTDLLRFFHLQTSTPPRISLREAGQEGDWTLLYSARQLREAGIKFKASTSKCLLDLEFSGSLLQIPQIMVEDRTETLFRNMIALEQCHYPLESYITDYTSALDFLINENKDVEVLIKRNIVCNYLGDTNDVALLFSGLGKNVVQSNANSDYVRIFKQLNDFYQDPWHKMKATLRRDYCKTPWQTVGTIAAIILLILTIVQTVCSILQVVFH